ncbi:hypothetical protein FA13DRAFT_1716720 [Coprinellus micaceus]|uniref:SUN domain-containing protein n=1 Tax=Coprinellus micaceus TaxID=71717 RepID=A0A4Y7SIN9_COPMI|nr:hypothetical protein FA13DRAFT_1716720 [Coprinellus micaceus]
MVSRMQSWHVVHDDVLDSKNLVHVPLDCFREGSHRPGSTVCSNLEQRGHSSIASESRVGVSIQPRDLVISFPLKSGSTGKRASRQCSVFATVLYAIVFLLVLGITFCVSTFGGWKFLMAICRHTSVNSWPRLKELCPVVDATAALQHPNFLEQYVNGIVDKRIDWHVQQHRKVQEVNETILDQDLSQVVLGARVLIQLTSPTARHDPPSSASSVHLPVVVLEPSLILGDCWLSVRKHGHVAIQLPRPANLTSVVIHYFPLRHLPPADRLRAPRTLVLWGLLRDPMHSSLPQPVRSRPPMEFARRNELPQGIAPKDVFVPLANMTYDLTGQSKQVTYLGSSVFQSFCFDIVVVEVTDNWGDESTCLYHVGVHGQLYDACS